MAWSNIVLTKSHPDTILQSTGAPVEITDTAPSMIVNCAAADVNGNQANILFGGAVGNTVNDFKLLGAFSSLAEGTSIVTPGSSKSSGMTAFGPAYKTTGFIEAGVFTVCTAIGGSVDQTFSYNAWIITSVDLVATEIDGSISAPLSAADDSSSGLAITPDLSTLALFWGGGGLGGDGFPSVASINRSTGAVNQLYNFTDAVEAGEMFADKFIVDNNIENISVIGVRSDGLPIPCQITGTTSAFNVAGPFSPIVANVFTCDDANIPPAANGMLNFVGSVGYYIYSAFDGRNVIVAIDFSANTYRLYYLEDGLELNYFFAIDY